MRNPRSLSTFYHPTSSFVQLRQSGGGVVSSDPAGTAPWIFEALSDNDGFTDTLKFLKFSPDEIERATQFVSTIGKIAATGNWIYGAYKTTVAVLTFLGILEREKSQELEILKKLAEKIEAMYKHMEIDAAKAPFIQAVGWRAKLSGMANAIRNAATSRSQENIDDLRDVKRELQEVLLVMLDPKTAEITFNRQTQGYFPEKDKDHWVRAAAPHLMTHPKGPLADNYAAAANLGHQIWDPGFYLDILFDALALRLSAAAIIEPLFRSTGYDRGDLVDIYKRLGTFITTWENTFLQSNLEGTLDPADQLHWRVGLGVLGTDLAPVSGRRMWSADGWCTPYLTLGAADPVTGVTAINFDYARNFSIVECRPFSGSGTYPVLANYQDVRVQLYNDRAKALRIVTAASSIGKLREARDHLDSILSAPYWGASEVVDTTDPKIDAFAVQVEPVPEQLGLGNLDKFAPQPGKVYSATRHHGATTKRFRVTLGRRMDVSGIQLGYRMELSAGGGEVLNLPLVDYSEQESTQEESLQPFPIDPILGKSLHTETARIYDVVQSGLFSATDEDAFEAAGEVDGKERLFLNERAGPASIEVDLRFSTETPEPGPSFVGFVDVEMRAPDKWPKSHGFIVACKIYEFRWQADPVFIDKPAALEETLVETLHIHVCPSFLVVGPDFFTDYHAAWWNREQATLKTLLTYKKDFRMLWDEFRDPEPIEFQRRFVIRDLQMGQLLTVLEREAPEILAETLHRAALPIVRPAER